MIFFSIPATDANGRRSDGRIGPHKIAIGRAVRHPVSRRLDRMSSSSRGAAVSQQDSIFYTFLGHFLYKIIVGTWLAITNERRRRSLRKRATSALGTNITFATSSSSSSSASASSSSSSSSSSSIFDPSHSGDLLYEYLLYEPCFVCTAVLSATKAEAPLGGGGGGYSYSKPSGFGGFGGGGGAGGGYSSGGYSSGGGGGGSYVQVPPGPSTYEGQYVDPKLLEQVRQVILKEESNGGSSSGGSSSGGFGGYPSSSYGAPSTSYGAPPSSSYGAPSGGGGYASRVTGIDLEGVKAAIQVAQYEQSGGFGGYSGSGLSSTYGAPSGHGGGGGGFSSLGGSYAAPSKPSGSYGAPF
ncbi:hypothetical protein V9T40_007468 [Parthenolecanium corni]|uniref:Uncharacterized protein n=1 Tax=Parthenolecanium corni TaxID=536013 RepID=A0AAN9TH42_9HEMI